jgi:hypothetical protein
LTEKSPLPPISSQIDLPGGKAIMWNIHCIRKISWHPSKSLYNSAADSNSETEDWLNWTGDIDDSNNDDTNGQANNKDEMDLSDNYDTNDEPEVKLLRTSQV